jgi:hypothetical protein
MTTVQIPPKGGPFGQEIPLTLFTVCRTQVGCLALEAVRWAMLWQPCTMTPHQRFNLPLRTVLSSPPP